MSGIQSGPGSSQREANAAPNAGRGSVRVGVDFLVRGRPWRT